MQNKIRLGPLLLGVAVWLLWLGCSASHKTLVESLDEIAKSDLEDILRDLPPTAKGSILAKPNFITDEFEVYEGDSSLVFQARAVVVYFYLDPSVNLCQVRKYRFKRSAGIWDRYDIKLIHIPEKFRTRD